MVKRRSLTCLVLALSFFAGRVEPLFAGVLCGTPNSQCVLYRIDPNDASFELVGTWSDISTINGLAYIPEPSSMVLLALGGVAMLRRRKGARAQV